MQTQHQPEMFDPSETHIVPFSKRLTLQSSRRLRRAELVFETMTLPALIIDASGHITDANLPALRLLEAHQGYIIGKTAAALFHLPPETITYLCAEAQGRAEVPLRLPDLTRWLELRFTRIGSRRDESYLVLLDDITSRMQEKEAHDQLVQSLESYAGTIAHDLKAPLTTMLGFASLLEMDRDSLNEDQGYYVGAIQRMSRRLTEMVDDLLLFATLRHLDQIPRTEVDVQTLLPEVLSRLHHLITTHHATLLISTNLPNAVGYQPWVEVVFANYISNAIKYGGKPCRVAIGGNLQGSKAYFWVHDNGAGLNDEQRAILFNRSSRFDPSQRGHGLGLLVVRQIIERLGGDVGVESTPGHGSTFYFTLPTTAF